MNLNANRKHKLHCYRSEFWNPNTFELHNGKKSKLEKNHEFIRTVSPQGYSLDNLTQDICDKLVSNINSLHRQYLNNKTPYKAMELECSEKIINSLNISTIHFYDVNLNNKSYK